MIDTIHLIYKFTNASEAIDCINRLNNQYSVDFHYRETNDNTKYVVKKYSCWSDGFRIWYISNQLHIEGSLTKLYYGDNIQQLNKETIPKAYELFLSKFDIVDWKKAYHKRLDLGVNLNISIQPCLVMNKLIGSKRMKKCVISSKADSVTIGNKSQSIIFYDKIVEHNNKCNSVSQLTCKMDNILRIEYRITGKHPFKKYFSNDNVSIQCIINNIELLPKILYTVYDNIEKEYCSTINSISNKEEMEMKALISYGLDNAKNLVLSSYKANKMTQSTKQNLLRYLTKVLNYQKMNVIEIDVISEVDQMMKMFLQQFNS